MSIWTRIVFGGSVLAIAAAVLAWAYFHIEHLGENKVRREVAVALEAQRVVDAKEITDAQKALTELQARFDTAVHTVPRPDPAVSVRVCNPVRSSPAPANASAVARANEAVRPPAAVAEPSEGRDVTAITETVLVEAGARIAYLQGYILTCQEQGFCAR